MDLQLCALRSRLVRCCRAADKQRQLYRWLSACYRPVQLQTIRKQISTTVYIQVYIYTNE